jgi:hypothetical protein
VNHEPTVLRLPTDAKRQQMLSEFAALRRRKTRNHRVALMGAVALLAVGSTAGALAIARAPQAVINNATECYGAADLNSTHFPSVNVVGDPQSKQARPVSERVAQGIDGCAASWRIGTFEANQSSIPAGKLFAVPRLVACQLPDGRVGIFPSGKSAKDLCADLDLALPHNQ